MPLLSLMIAGLLRGPDATLIYLEGLQKLWVTQVWLMSKGE